MRVLITGSRSWDDASYIRKVLTEFGEAHAGEELVLVSGACPDGADRLCEIVASDLGWAIELHPADWQKHGRRAGFVRNSVMVNSSPDVCLGFVRNRSAGGSMTVKLAKEAGLLTVLHAWDDKPTPVFQVKVFNDPVPEDPGLLF